MELSFHSYWILLIHFILGVTALDYSTIACDQTYYAEVGTQAVVSCEYDHSFFAVRWYFDGSELSFLRMDGTSKSGSGIDSGEFDIDDDGSMVITEVELKHEGNYRISVLDSSGTITSKDIMVYAMVLLNKVVITDCKSSSIELCTKLSSQQRESTLLCVAKNSRPPVEIVWKTTFQKENVIHPTQNYNVDMDPTSLLYTSSSYMQFESKFFSLEYFTCQVNGVAAQNVHNASLLLEGSGEFLQHTGNAQYVQKGSSFYIVCPKNNFQFALLKVTYSSGIEKLLMTLHPGHDGRQCLDSIKCQVEEDGLITIENASFKDEGSYECVFGDGVDSYSHVLNLTVVVSPSPPVTIIEGCEDTLKCQMSAPVLGSLKCSLFGSRPSTNLSYEVAETSAKDIVISNIRNQIVHAKETNTFNTVLTAEYEIMKCGNPVKITCQAESEVHSNTKVSEIFLVSDEENCKDKPNTAMIVFLVLFVVLLLAVSIAVIFVFIKKMRGNL